MGRTLRRYEIVLEAQFAPPRELEVVEVGLVGDDKFALMGEGVPAMETAPPKSTALELETMVKVCPKRGGGTSPLVLTLSTWSFFIQIN